MNKAEEFRMKTAMYLAELNIAAEEFCNEMLLKFEENEVAAGLYESSFVAEDVPNNLRPHFKGDLMICFKKGEYYASHSCKILFQLV